MWLIGVLPNEVHCCTSREHVTTDNRSARRTGTLRADDNGLREAAQRLGASSTCGERRPSSRRSISVSMASGDPWPSETASSTSRAARRPALYPAAKRSASCSSSVTDFNLRDTAARWRFPTKKEHDRGLSSVVLLFVRLRSLPSHVAVTPGSAPSVLARRGWRGRREGRTRPHRRTSTPDRRPAGTEGPDAPRD